MNARAGSALLAAIALGVGIPTGLHAMEIPFTRPEYRFLSHGQLNVVVMDREAGLIHLIPNLRLTGTGYDFTLIIPTPSAPTVETVEDGLWPQILNLTRPTQTRQNSGCGHYAGTQPLPVDDPNDLGVLVNGTVGGFRVKIMAPDREHPGKVTAWLAANGFAFGPEDSTLVYSYEASGWYFCTLRFDPSQTTARQHWDTNVKAVRLTFEAEELEIPLPLFRVNRASTFPMGFLVVDDHRADLPGFTTTYANRITADELAAMYAYPQVTPYLAPGRFLTRLERVFSSDDQMRHSVVLGRAPEDREYRRVDLESQWSGFPAGLLGLTVLMLLGRASVRRVKPR